MEALRVEWIQKIDIKISNRVAHLGQWQRIALKFMLSRSDRRSKETIFLDTKSLTAQAVALRRLFFKLVHSYAVVAGRIREAHPRL